jgi:acyl-CoA reductase-like NAD-dependent aldehyde dehydrogenase
LLADSSTPCVAELSGCDAVIALPSADLNRLAHALAFGMRFNGSATCMAPRRLFLVGFTSTRQEAAIAAIRAAFSEIEPVPVTQATFTRLNALLQSARREGANATGRMLFSDGTPLVAPMLITDAQPAMEITRTDIFAPLLSVLSVPGLDALLAADAKCAYALTSAIFGSEAEARAVAPYLRTGTVLINDVIVPTADPRLPFTGRRRSGFGSTRGAEGLLEMTMPRTTTVRRGSTRRQHGATGSGHFPLFEAMIRISHAGSLSERIAGLRDFISAARKLSKEPDAS